MYKLLFLAITALGLITNVYASCHNPFHFIIDTTNNKNLILRGHDGIGANYSVFDGSNIGFYWDTEKKVCLLGYTYFLGIFANELEHVSIGTTNNNNDYCELELAIDGAYNVTPYIKSAYCNGRFSRVQIEPDYIWEDDSKDPNAIVSGAWLYKLEVT